MKTTLLLSTLAIGLIGATASFAQQSPAASPPAGYPYPQEYRDSGARGPDWSDHQGRTERPGHTERR
jgi:hypothetical protein